MVGETCIECKQHRLSFPTEGARRAIKPLDLAEAFIKFLVDHGIAKETSTPYRPQQNGVAERTNRTIVEMAMSSGERGLYEKPVSNKGIGAALWLGGDIHPDLGPLSHITKDLPQAYKQRLKQYFLPNTTLLKPRYTHLENLFTPHLTHGTHNPCNQELTQIQRHKPTLSKYPMHLQIFALILSYSPIPQVCNQRLSTGLDPIGHLLLRKLHKLSEDTQLHTHLNTNLVHDNTPNTIEQVYTHINTKIVIGEK